MKPSSPTIGFVQAKMEIERVTTTVRSHSIVKTITQAPYIYKSSTSSSSFSRKCGWCVSSAPFRQQITSHGPPKALTAPSVACHPHATKKD